MITCTLGGQLNHYVKQWQKNIKTWIIVIFQIILIKYAPCQNREEMMREECMEFDQLDKWNGKDQEYVEKK